MSKAIPQEVLSAKEREDTKALENMGRKGGLASGRKRRENRDLEDLKLQLEMEDALLMASERHDDTHPPD